MLLGMVPLSRLIDSSSRLINNMPAAQTNTCHIAQLGEMRAKKWVQRTYVSAVINVSDSGSVPIKLLFPSDSATTGPTPAIAHETPHQLHGWMVVDSQLLSTVQPGPLVDENRSISATRSGSSHVGYRVVMLTRQLGDHTLPVELSGNRAARAAGTVPNS